jgi:hypothetical protein
MALFAQKVVDPEAGFGRLVLLSGRGNEISWASRSGQVLGLGIGGGLTVKSAVRATV